MTTWILVIMIHAGVPSRAVSMAITHVPGFKTEAECMVAGKASEDLGKNTTKDVKFVCLKQS